MTRILLLAICVLCPLSLHGEPASFEFFQVPGATSLLPASMNDTLGITGSYTLADGTTHAFLRTGSGRLIKFDVGAVSTQPVRVNASGEIAGTFSDVAGVDQGFLRFPNGTTTRFQLGSSTQVTDMNANGTVVGVFTATESPSSQAFFRTRNGIVSFFAVPGSTFVYPESIDDAGQIAGFYFFNASYDGGVGGFVRSPAGNVSTFVSNGGIVPLALNQMGIVTGWYAPPTGSFAPFVRQPDGVITHFRVPGSLVTQGMSMNASGVIAGSYTTVDNGNPEGPQTATHGFLRTPQG